MADSRNTRKYHIYKNRRLIYAGISTRPLDTRLAEHRQDFGDGISIRQVGVATTAEAAREWEKGESERGVPTSKT